VKGSPLHRIGLTPLPARRPADRRSEFPGQYHGGSLDPPSWRALRTRTHTYVEWQDGSGDRELYDLRADPFQLTNLLAKPTPADTALAARLAARLRQLSDRASPSCRQ
jgi:N-acetylglucosamine-6-sulfatase